MIDYTSMDYNGFKSLMISSLQERIPAYTDTSETDAGIVILEAVCRVMDILSFYQNSQATECFLSTAEQRINALKWCRMLGYTPYSCSPAQYTQIFELKGSVGELITIPKGTLIHTGFDSDGTTVLYSTLEEVSAVIGESGTATIETRVAHGYEVGPTTLGVANDSIENQTFLLKDSPVSLPDYDSEGYALATRPLFNSEQQYFTPDGYDMAKDFKLFVGGELWILKNSLIDSTAKDKHYTVEVTQDNYIQIYFGDGRCGAIPKGTVEVFYRKGGGSIGNVGSGTICNLFSGISGVVSTYNVDTDRVLGTDKETVSSIRVNAPNSHRTKWACLESSDYSRKVLELFAGRVKLATAFRLSDRVPIDYRTTIADATNADWKKVDTIQVCVLPDWVEDNVSVDSDNEKVYLRVSDVPLQNELILALQESLEERALVGTYIDIAPFVSKPINLRCTVLARDGYSAENLSSSINDTLHSLFALGQIEGGQTISLNDVETDIFERFPGIRAFRIDEWTYDGLTYTDLSIPSEPWEIVELFEVVIVNADRSGGVSEWAF